MNFKQNIEIKSFGPIEHVKFEINDIIVLNGKQSSGKSTIAKVIYLFKSLPEILFKAMISDEQFTIGFDKNIVVQVRTQLLAIFGTTKHFDNFLLKFFYSEQDYIEIAKDHKSGHAWVKFSPSLKKTLQQIAIKVDSFWKESKGQAINDYYAFYASSRLQFFNMIKKEIEQLFNEKRRTLYLPAGRSLVSTLSGELRNIESYNFDYLMKDFIEKIVAQRELFSKSLDEIVEDKKRLTSIPIDFEYVDFAKRLSKEIIQADYRYENGEEKLIIDNKNYVKIKFSSSGQQESLWIVNFLFLHLLENSHSFTVYEEPEAHLYPNTQYPMSKFIALGLSKAKNQAIITTHSPYILASLNTFILAGQVGKKYPQKTTQIIDKKFWVDSSRVSAYFVADGQIHNILDNDSKIIDPKYIDIASEAINKDFDTLLELMD